MHTNASRSPLPTLGHLVCTTILALTSCPLLTAQAMAAVPNNYPPTGAVDTGQIICAVQNPPVVLDYPPPGIPCADDQAVVAHLYCVDEYDNGTFAAFACLPDAQSMPSPEPSPEPAPFSESEPPADSDPAPSQAPVPSYGPACSPGDVPDDYAIAQAWSYSSYLNASGIWTYLANETCMTPAVACLNNMWTPVCNDTSPTLPSPAPTSEPTPSEPAETNNSIQYGSSSSSSGVYTGEYYGTTGGGGKQYGSSSSSSGGVAACEVIVTCSVSNDTAVETMVNVSGCYSDKSCKLDNGDNLIQNCQEALTAAYPASESVMINGYGTCASGPGGYTTSYFQSSNPLSGSNSGGASYTSTGNGSTGYNSGSDSGYGSSSGGCGNNAGYYGSAESGCK